MLRKSLIFSLLFLCSVVNADLGSMKSRSRFGTQGGLGQSDVSVEGRDSSEGPFAFSFFYDTLIDERRLIGVEHTRSFNFDEGQLSTAIAFTGLYGKWFPWSPISQRLMDNPTESGIHLTQKTLSPYFSLGFGFAQSSLRDKIGGATTKGAVGFYTSVRAGMEVPLYKMFGAMFEVGYATTLAGEGQISMMTSLIGIYVYL